MIININDLSDADGVLVRSETVDTVSRMFIVRDGAGQLVSERPLTADENERVDEYLLRLTVESNDSTIRTQAESALVDLRTLANSSGTLNGANLSNAVRLLARVCIGLVRLQLTKLDATD
jgi:hypothetical protein